MRGKLYGSGTNLFVETIQDQNQATFLARRRDGAYVVLANVKGRLRTVSWNRIGLAAVVDDTALIWPAGSKEFTRVTTDKGLTQTRDSCLVGSDRAVVALNDSVLVLTPNGATALVGMHARCAWDGNSLYLLDENSGLIWRIQGVDKLGTRAGDLAHAEELVSSLPPNSPSDSAAFLEAARIVGCNEVIRLRTESHVHSQTSATVIANSSAKTMLEYLGQSNQEIDQGDYRISH